MAKAKQAPKRRRDMVREELEFDELSVNLAATSISKAQQRQAWWRRGLIAFLVLGSLVMVGQTAQFVAAFAFPEEQKVDLRLDSPGRAQATVTVEQWLGQSPSPLPGGQLVAWEGVTEERVEPVDSTQSPYTIEVHTFSLASGLSLFDATVQVWVNDLGQAHVLTQPQLVPRMPQAGSASSTIWPGYQTAQAPQPVEDAVASWSESFTSGDPARLKLATGDPDVTRVYMPLPKAASVTSQIDFAGVPQGQSSEQAQLMLARATITIVWPGQESTGSETYQTMSYDLLVQNPNSGSPTIVSWSGAGAGPTLSPYSVGVIGLEQVEPGDGITEPEDEPVLDEDGVPVESPEETADPGTTGPDSTPLPAAPAPTTTPSMDPEDPIGEMPVPTFDPGGQG